MGEFVVCRCTTFSPFSLNEEVEKQHNDDENEDEFALNCVCNIGLVAVLANVALRLIVFVMAMVLFRWVR